MASVNEIRRNILLNTPHLSQASGAIASFSTDFVASLKSCIVDINPVQSLNGQSSPYPAGGGKNKLDPTLLKDQSYWNTITLDVEPNTQYTASSDVLSSSVLLIYFDNTGTQGGSAVNKVYSTKSVTVTSTADGHVYISQRRTATSESFANINVQVEKGSTATAYAPYSNICPISGWTGVNVHVADGENPHVVDNIYPITWQSTAGTVYGGNIDVLSGVLTATKGYDTIDENSSISTSATGVFKFVTTNVTIKPRYIDGGLDNFMCDILACKSVMGASASVKENLSIYNNTSGGETTSSVYFAPDKTNITTVAQAQTWLESNPIHFVYPLASPIIYQMTPTQVKTIVGQNNIFADTGNVSLKYWTH